MRIVGWTPLKHSSSRLPGKNTAPLAGKPLFAHMVDTMRACALLDDVYINTDSETVMALALERYRDAADAITVIVRKPEHREPTLSTVEMLIDDLETMNADLVVFTHCTVPLLRPETLEAGIQAYIDNAPRYDSVLSVTRMHERFYDHLGRAMNFHQGIILPLQDLPPVYVENNAFFILEAETARRLHNRVGQRPYLFEVDPLEAVDIDYQRDLDYAEWLIRCGSEAYVECLCH